MRFGKFTIVSTILFVCMFEPVFSSNIATNFDRSANEPSQEPNHRTSYNLHQTDNQSFVPRVRDNIRLKLNKFRSADRRVFFSFNQLLLSLIAPRLMRYQFDLMMHSVVAELFRKILVPAIGTASGGDSLFSSVGNLLKLRQTAPKTTTAAPNLDVQRLLDNAQKLIALQSLIRNNNHNNNGQTMSRPSSHQHHQSPAHKPQPSIDLQSHPNINHGSESETKFGKANNSTTSGRSGSDHFGIHHQSYGNDSAHSNQKSDQPIQFAISPKDLINFLQSNLKMDLPNSSNNNTHNPSNSNPIDSSSSPTSASFHPQTSLEQQLPKFSFASPFVSFGKQHSLTDPYSMISKTNTMHNPNNVLKHKAKLDDFKISHLTYIDTEVPNYGNQLLIRDHEDSPYNNNNNEVTKNSFELKTQLSLLDSSSNGDKESSNTKNNDEQERAFRWNNVLVNMKRNG